MKSPLHVLSCILIGLFVCLPAFAERHEFFRGEAKENGKVVYFESHDVTFDDAHNPIEAKTIYTDPQGTVLGVLQSNFRQSLSLQQKLSRSSWFHSTRETQISAQLPSCSWSRGHFY